MHLKFYLIIITHWYVATLQAQYSAKIQTVNNRPTMVIDEAPVLPIIYSPTHATGGRWSWEEVPQRNISNFCKVGIETFQLDIYFEDVWCKDQDTLDMTKALKQIRGAVEVCSKAKIFLRVHVNAPFWWNEKYKEECTVFADGAIKPMHYGVPLNNEDGDTDLSLRASLASTKWREESGQKLKEFCQKLSKSTEGNHIVGLHVSGGVFGEWHYWGFPAHSPDVGTAMTSHFRKWLTNKYKTDAMLAKAWKNNAYTLANATVPDTAERYTGKYGDYRDVALEQRVIDYFTCQQQVVADDIEYFCKIVKNTWPRPLIVGIFYGYFQQTFSHQARGGHLCVEQILNSPYIDYISWPTAYHSTTKELGGSGNSRGISESTLLHTKLFLEEVDNGYLQNKRTETTTHVEMSLDTSFLAITRRNIIRPILRGGGMWFYDFGLKQSRGWWDLPEYMQDIKSMVHILKQNMEKPFKNQADVLVVYDQESFYYIKDDWTPMSFDFLDQTSEDIFRAGALIEQIYLFDLPKVNLDKYKVVVFMNIYKVNADMRRFIKEKVANNNRLLIYQYLPGITDGHTTHINLTSNLIGIKLQKIPAPDIKPKVILENGITYSLEKYPSPWVKVVDKNLKSIGVLEHDNSPAIYEKVNSNHKIMYAKNAMHTPELFREIFQKAGAHIYSSSNVSMYESSGLIYFHYKEKGKKTITLRNGKKVSFETATPGTVILDANTGNIVAH